MQEFGNKAGFALLITAKISVKQHKNKHGVQPEYSSQSGDTPHKPHLAGQLQPVKTTVILKPTQYQKTIALGKR